MDTVTKTWHSDYRVKGSKFLGYLAPATTLDEAEQFLNNIKAEHPTATHHCYAYRINPNEPDEFASDDGEPGGTAGLPILNSAKAYNLINIVLIVVRYYGGTKLGKAGLIETYGHTAELTIKQAKLYKILPVKTFKIVYDYPHQGLIDKLKHDFTWIELDSSYLEKVTLKCGCPVSEANRFLAALKKSAHLFDDIDVTGETFHIVK